MCPNEMLAAYEERYEDRRPRDMAIATRQSRVRAGDAKQDARRFPRQTVSWLVTVSTGSRQLQGRTKDTSAAGAKILVEERLPLGSQVLLQFRPAGRSPVETHALVWRLDPDGFACVFVGSQGPKFLETVTPYEGRSRSPGRGRSDATGRCS